MRFYELIEDRKKCLFVILLISISIKIVYFFHFKENPFFFFIHPMSDAINFDAGAQSFSSGDLLATSANNSYSPLYKYFLGFIYILAGRNLPVVWGIQLMMGTITILLVFLITSKLFNNRAAFISAILYAFYGPELMYEGILLRASFISFLGVLSLYLLIILEEKRDFFRIVAAGFVISLFIQSRPNVILVFFFLLLIPAYSSAKKNINKIITLNFVVLLFFIPLLIQAYIVHGEFVFFDASGPKAILFGNNLNYTGAGYYFESLYPSENFKEVFLLLLSNIVSHPFEMIALYFRKFYYFFNSHEFPTNYNFYIFQEFSFLLKNPLSNFAVFSSLGLMGFLININNFKRLRLLNTYLIGMTMSVVLLYVVSRFRVPVVPYYAIFTGCFLDRVCAWRVLKKYNKIFFSAAVFIAFQFFFNTTPDKFITDKAGEYENLGNAYLNIGNVEKAMALYAKSLKLEPNNFYLHNNFGKFYADRGQPSDAINEFKKALKLNPKQWEPHYNLGLVYLQSRQFKKGEKELLFALKLAPGEAPIHFSLGNIYEATGSYEQSMKYYKSYIALLKDDWKGYFYLGNILSRLNYFESAIKEYNKSKKLNPKHSQTLVNLGNAYSLMNKHSLALQEYLLALSINIKDPVIYKNIGILYSRKDFYHPVKAIEYLQKYLELDAGKNSAESIQKLINQLKNS